MKFERGYDYVLWESDFSEAVAELYGRPFRLQQMDMRGNDSYMEFDVVEEWVPGSVEDAAAAIQAWQEEWNELNASDASDLTKKLAAVRDQFIDFELLVVDLHERGELPVGRYLMKVWW